MMKMLNVLLVAVDFALLNMIIICVSSTTQGRCSDKEGSDYLDPLKNPMDFFLSHGQLAAALKHKHSPVM